MVGTCHIRFRRPTQDPREETASMAATHVAQGIGAVQVPRVPTQLFIDGTWRDAVDGATFDVVAPATEDHLATIAAAGEADIDAAVAAARAQADGGEWAKMHGRDRGLLLYRLADAIEREIDALATLEALDIGRPAFEPKMVDLPHVVDVIRHFAGWADKIEGRWVTPAPFFGMTRQAYTIREPVGVVGAITAWNAPALIASWKLGPALAAGNAVVLKPAEDASLSTLWIAKLIEEVGFPAGVVNVVPGFGETAGPARLQEGHARARRQVAAERPLRREPRGRHPRTRPGLLRQPGRDLRGRH